MNLFYKKTTSSVKHSIAVKLLSYVLSIYLLLTIVATLIHISIVYQNAKQEVQQVLVASERTFHDILAADLWNMNDQDLKITIESIEGLPHITGVELTSQEQNLVLSSGITHNNSTVDEDLFYHQFALTKKLPSATSTIGIVKLYSNHDYVVRSILPSIYLLVITAIVKMVAIFILVIIVFRKLLTKPLGKLADHASRIDPENMHLSLINIASDGEDELGILQKSLNDMMHKTSDVIGKLDELNKKLELKVASRTQELQLAVENLDTERTKLEQEVQIRKHSEAELSNSLAQLKTAHDQLIEAEKMASLGELVAGVAHEINTPIGLSFTGISHFQTTVKELAQLYEDKKLDARYFTEFIAESSELANIIFNNLQRASELVQSFKRVAVDQSHEELREFDLIEYLNETLVSLRNETKKGHIKIVIESELQPLIIRNFPGAWAQLFTNLIQNALKHAFLPESQGVIKLHFSIDDEQLNFEFSDTGIGMDEETKKKIFDPFFTTARGSGGSGLGMHIAYNIVMQKMRGKITVESELDQGTTFFIQVPRYIESDANH